MNNIYEEYGQLMIQSEILNGRILAVKKLIQEDLNKQVVKEEVKEEPK